MSTEKKQAEPIKEISGVESLKCMMVNVPAVF